MPLMTSDELKAAHKHSFKSRAEIEKSSICGCFYCGRMFAPTEIAEWTDDGQTAMCPCCGIDSVVGSASGFQITKEFLDEMNTYWF